MFFLTYQDSCSGGFSSLIHGDKQFNMKVISHEGQEVMPNKPGGIGKEVRPESRQTC